MTQTSGRREATRRNASRVWEMYSRGRIERVGGRPPSRMKSATKNATPATPAVGGEGRGRRVGAPGPTGGEMGGLPALGRTHPFLHRRLIPAPVVEEKIEEVGGVGARAERHRQRGERGGEGEAGEAVRDGERQAGRDHGERAAGHGGAAAEAVGERAGRH